MSLAAAPPDGTQTALDSQDGRARQRALLSAVMRQHESAVFSYVYRRVRRSVDAGRLVQDVFARLYASGDLSLDLAEQRQRLLALCQEVLAEFAAQAAPADAAWTTLCLELDALVNQRRQRI